MFELVMMGKESATDLVEFKPERENLLDAYYSVQFFLNDNGPTYQFKLRNTSSRGPCILVKQDSSVFRELKVGDVLDMEYNPAESIGAGRLFKTQIASKKSHDRYTGHYVVELSIISNQNEKKD